MGSGNNKTFKVGDKIVRFGQVYRIFKIKKKIIFFRPYFEDKKNRTLIRSIPTNNIDKTDIRKPISQKELRQLLRDLSKKSDIKKTVNIIKAREQLSLNDPYKNVEILKCLWIEKNDESTNFSKSREDILKLVLNLLVEEVAFVSRISLVEAREKIKSALERGTKNDKQNKA